MTMVSDDPWASLNTPARTPRTLDTREQTQKRKEWGGPASKLPDPAPQDGYVFRWVRSEALGVLDKKNYSGKLREGWEPVRAEDHPEVTLGLDIKNGIVEIGGLILCKWPEEFTRARQAHYRNLTLGQIESAEAHYMNDSDRRMPKFSQRRTTFGRDP